VSGFSRGRDDVATKKSFIDVMKRGCAILLAAAPWIFGLDRWNIAT
jgi:hypothetical protein